MPKTETAIPESKYSRAELIENARAIFGVQREVVEGALANNKSIELTLKEVKEAIKVFLNRKPE